MGTPFFKITASLVKPTRETLLDYCSYCLIVIAVVGVARVWIGGAGLQSGCFMEPLESSGEDLSVIRVSKNLRSLEVTEQPYTGSMPKSAKEKNAEAFVPAITYMVAVQNEFYQPITGIPDTFSQNWQDEDRILGNSGYPSETIDDGSIGNSSQKARQKCAKQYQTMFAYILLIESTILLFVGLTWVKIPNVSHIIDEFAKLIHSCEKSNWAKKALHIIDNKGRTDNMSQSLYSIVSGDSAVYDIKSLLDTLFRPEGDYKAKSSARHLYEKVQIFCNIHSQKTMIWTTYIMKSFLQFALWVVVFNINLVLFVVLEFYIMCPEDSPTPCNHDMFLRIIWFMAQMVFLIYAVFNCKTLRWINEKSVVRQWSCCNYINCFKKHITLYTNDESPLLTCRPYRFANNSPVYNDIALLLHLLEEAHPKVLPYFVVFMFPEWKEKLTSFANPVQMTDIPIRSAMQMISGRPPPIIEITDIPSMSDVEEHLKPHAYRSSSLPKKKSMSTVTFYIGNEIGESKNNGTKKPTAEKVFLPSQTPMLSLPHHNHHKSRPKAVKPAESCARKSPSLLLNVGMAPSDSPREMTGEHTDETTALVHRTSSSESIKSSDLESSGSATESNRSSDLSESRSLLGNT